MTDKAKNDKPEEKVKIKHTVVAEGGWWDGPHFCKEGKTVLKTTDEAKYLVPHILMPTSELKAKEKPPAPVKPKALKD